MPIYFSSGRSGGGSVEIPGFDNVFVDEASDTLYRRNDDGTLTQVAATVTLSDAGVGIRSLSRAAAGKFWLPSDVVCESYPLALTTNVGLTTVSLRVRLAGNLVIPAGKTITDIEFWSGTTAFTGITHLYFGLYDLSYNLLASSADAGATTWAASTAKRLALSTPYVASVDTAVYAACMPEVTTPGTLAASSATSTAVTATALGGVTPASPLASGSTLPNPIAALTSGSAVAYVRLIGS